jgi:hypothetical protein
MRKSTSPVLKENWSFDKNKDLTKIKPSNPSHLTNPIL